jgi:hypothetical protein
LDGAPDETGAGNPFGYFEEEEVEYPPRLEYQPHWLRVDCQVTYPGTIKLYHWVKNCHKHGTNIQNSSSHWLSAVETKALEIESYKILEAFRKPVVTPTYYPLVQAELDILSFQYRQNHHNKTIDTILLILHPVETLNQHLADFRPLACYRKVAKFKLQFEFIEEPIIQWYLSKRITEWIAFGGQRFYQIGIYNTRNYQKRALLRQFYWDIWKDIRNLR